MTDSFVTRLIRWWSHQDDAALASYFADDFAYNDGSADTTREDFLLLRESSGVIDEIKFIELQCHGSTASAMFEGTDGITHLRHRICWIITSEGDKIRRISACVGNVLGPEERTVWK